ncbi:zinc finger protein 346-like [Abrus precatorius]|uniref:Zinc finger protein 346-like n=1 Tax=Abrus precatorius TaxID=3816 RepID=A0A8B8JPW7_ABRPR|nr:zinc finger protein 346-like [Abrus precatorius]
MYPQQQHHVPFTNVHQPYCSANPFLLSFPLNSDSAHHPPATDPLANSTPSSVAAPYSSQSFDSHNWIVKQADPVTFDHAVGPSHETSAASASFPITWNGTWSHQIFTNDATVVSPNQIRLSKPIRCEVCKIDCNSKDVYEKHILGKKHKRNLQVQTNPPNSSLAGPSYASVPSQTNSIQGKVSDGAAGKELKSKEQKLSNGGSTTDSAKVCTVCNIVCTSQDVYNKHLAGKKHTAQVGLMLNNGIGPYIAAFKHQGIGPWKKSPKKIKVDQSAWCDVCKIKCNSRDVYIVHLCGKKHMKNLEKLSKPKIDAGDVTAVVNALQETAKPIIGPQEKPGTDKPKSQKAPEMDIETKKRKVVEGGAAEASVRICTLCNVVCNSQTVFDTHLVGHKHAAMAKKQGESTGETTC